MPVSTSERLCIRLKYSELLCAQDPPPKTVAHSKFAPLLALRGVWYGGKSAVILDFGGIYDS